MSRCLYLLAVLANLERNHRQAKALLEKAQLLGGDEQFWYNSTLSLTEAILEEEGEGKQSMVRKFFGFGDCGLGVFSAMLSLSEILQPFHFNKSKIRC